MGELIVGKIEIGCKGIWRGFDWADKWQMSFNVGKCKVMHLGGHNLEWNYVMSQQRLKVVREERDLGVVLRDDLKVSGNCQQAYIYAKASRMLGLMARRFRSLEIMTRLYTKVWSDPIWSTVRRHGRLTNIYVKDGELLERVQRRFSRMVPGLRGLEYDERLERLGLMTLGERRNRADPIELFRISKGLSAISLESFFELDTSGRTRGHSLKLRRRIF